MMGLLDCNLEKLVNIQDLLENMMDLLASILDSVVSLPVMMVHMKERQENN